MLCDIEYCSYLDFSPRGSSKDSRQSQNIRDHVKAGRVNVVNDIVSHLTANNPKGFEAFFGDDVLLIPAPRSAPLVTGGVWPSLVITNVLESVGWGKETSPCLIRTKAVSKSSTAGKGKRPKASDHYDSMEVSRDLINPERILIVDDVITLGATLVAGVARVKEAYPDAEVKAFALLRTKSFEPDIENLVAPSISNVVYHNTGNVWRND